MITETKIISNQIQITIVEDVGSMDAAFERIAELNELITKSHRPDLALLCTKYVVGHSTKKLSDIVPVDTHITYDRRPGIVAAVDNDRQTIDIYFPDDEGGRTLTPYTRDDFGHIRLQNKYRFVLERVE